MSSRQTYSLVQVDRVLARHHIGNGGTAFAGLAGLGLGAHSIVGLVGMLRRESSEGIGAALVLTCRPKYQSGDAGGVCWRKIAEARKWSGTRISH
jgi:hypothetical protein